MEAGSKRKRDLECPRITYHTPERTFDRLFREDSLAQLKQVARKKLGLQADAVIDLSQIRGDTCIDLEDEDDFDAFYNAVHSSSTASIRVTIRDGAIAKNAKNKETPEKKRRRLVDVSQSSAAGTLSTSTPGPVSRKRAVSIAQSGANKTSEVQTAEPPAKRTKTTSTPSSEQPADSAQQLARFIDTPAPPPPAEFSKQGDTSDKAKATPNTAPGPPLTVAASISTSSPTAPVTNKGKPTPKAAPKLASKVVASALASSSTTPVLTPGAPIPTATPGADVNKSAKPVSEQAADVSTVQEHLSGLQDGALEAQGKAREKEKEVKVKVTREKKPKNKSKDKPKGIEDGKGKLPPAETVEGPATSETSETAAPTVQPPQAKETIFSAPAGQKDTKSKSKKAKSITSKDPLEVGAADKPKKKAKSKVRESSSAVNSETNDAVTADSQAEASNISAISRSIIEKYLTPSSPSSVVDAEDVAVQLASAIQASHGTTVKVTALPRPTCPYCGKSLTHDRSHCPLIRAKLPETIERRIAELKKDTSADPEGVRAKAIDVLKLAVQRKRGGETKKEKGSTVPPSEHPPSTIVPALTKTPTISFAHKPSSSSSSNSSDDDIPFKMSRFSHLPAPRESPPLQGVKTPHPSGVDKPLLLVPSQQPKPSLPHTVEKDGSSSSWEDHSESENSSEGEAPQPQPTATPAPAKPAPPPPQDSDSESSNSSSDVENTTASSHQPQPESQPSLFPPADVSNYSDKDLEALIRGPGVPLKFTELPSSESSEDEEPDGVQLDNESEQEPVSQTRKAPRFYAPSKDSSDEGEDENDDNEDSDTFHTLSAYTSAPPPVARAGPIEDGGKSHPIPEPSQDNKSFQQMGGRQSSVESDQGGNKAFEEALAQENVVFELAREPTSLPSAEESSRSAIVTQHSTDNSAVTNEPSKTDTDQEEGPGEAEFNNTDLGKGTIPEDIVEKEPELTQTLEPGHVEVLETLGDHVTGIPALLGLTEADGEVPSTPLPPPPEQPREEPTRASTPKPGILERMRSRVGLTLPVKNQPSRSSFIMTPVAKASSTRAATLRSQQEPKTRSQSTGSSHEENDADAGAITPGPVAGKPASRRGAVPASVSKSAPTRSKAAAEKNLERVQEDQEVPNPLPRRSTRTASKTPGTGTPMPPPPLKRARQARPPLVAEENRDSSQLRRRKVSQQKKGAPKATVKSPTPPPTTEDDNVEASSSQSVQPQEDVTLPPSPPVSLDTWETLQTETPVGTTQSDPMVDELQSDVDPIPFSLKPQYQRKTPTFGRNKPISRFEQAVHDADHPEKGKGKTKNTPLFMPSDSQTTFPHSQFQTPAAALVATDSSDSEAEVRNSVIKNRAPSQSQPPQYRKLTEIASQASSLFTPKVLRQSTTLSRAAASVPAKRKDRLDQMYGRMGKKSEVEESSNESSQSSDSETEKVSHIPKSRKAGAGSKRRMSLA